MILCRNHLFLSKMQNLSSILCRNRLFSSKMQNSPSILCRNHLFSSKMQNPPSILCRNHLFPSKMQKIEAHSQVSPPAAGRFCDKILFQPMAILAKRFYFIGRNFLWNKKTPSSLLVTRKLDGVLGFAPAKECRQPDSNRHEVAPVRFWVWCVCHSAMPASVQNRI